MNPGAKGGAKGGTTSSALAGDVLTAHFVRVGNRNHLAEVHGDGHTALRRVSATGVVNTGSGDSLVAHFRPVTAGAGRGSGRTGAGSTSGKQGRKDGLAGGGADEVSDAVEQGHVVMTQLPVRKPGEATAPLEERATAERAVFDGELERTILTGNVQVSNGTSVLWADRVTMEQQTGDAAADGAVKASYGQAGSTEEPVHVLAARAELKHDSQIATFHGVAGTPARLWQGASQVDAPVLQFEQKQRRLLAHGEGQGAPMAVHTVLVSGGASGTPAKIDSGQATGWVWEGDCGEAREMWFGWRAGSLCTPMRRGRLSSRAASRLRAGTAACGGRRLWCISSLRGRGKHRRPPEARSMARRQALRPRQAGVGLWPAVWSAWW